MRILTSTVTLACAQKVQLLTRRLRWQRPRLGRPGGGADPRSRVRGNGNRCPRPRRGAHAAGGPREEEALLCGSDCNDRSPHPRAQAEKLTLDKNS